MFFPKRENPSTTALELGRTLFPQDDILLYEGGRGEGDMETLVFSACPSQHGISALQGSWGVGRAPVPLTMTGAELLPYQWRLDKEKET